MESACQPGSLGLLEMLDCMSCSLVMLEEKEKTVNLKRFFVRQKKTDWVFTSFRGDFDDDVLKLRVLKTFLEGRIRFKPYRNEMQTGIFDVILNQSLKARQSLKLRGFFLFFLSFMRISTENGICSIKSRVRDV